MTDYSNRNLEIDFVKGLLVLTMVVYHTFVNFYTNYQIVTSLTKYVSGGFIYISGFLIGYYYLQRYSDDYARIRKRLLIRGLKILLIFVIANIAFIFFTGSNSERIADVFLYGTGLSRFEILLPISYLLLITALIVPYIRKNYILLNVLVVGLFVLIIIGNITKATNLYYLPIGLFGVANSLLIGKIKNTLGVQAICLLLVPLIAWLGLTYSFGSNIILYMLYIIVVLMTFYNIAKRLNLSPPKNLHLRGVSKRILLRSPITTFSQWILIFGRYLLFSFIFHLFIIVTLADIVQKKLTFIQNIFIVIIVSAILLISLVIIDNLRKRIEFIDKGYRFIFA